LTASKKTVAKNGKTLHLAAAIAQDGSALYYASEILKSDKELVLARDDKWALGSTSEKLKADSEVVLVAVCAVR